MSLERAEAERRSLDASVVADAEQYGLRFCETEKSLRLHKSLGITEPWNEWEYPRRIAAIRLGGERLKT